ALLAQTENVVSPGMTRAQVVAALGAPATQRTAAEYTYMFYANSCGRECGMNDLVILKHDSVSDAIFRSPNRHYTGTSSSPAEAWPTVATRRARPAAKPMTVKKSEPAKATAKPEAAKPAADKAAAPAPLKPPARATDVTPSIPVQKPTIPPAPAKTAPAKTTAPDKKTPG
ncbi:MAG TPA: hypothetical protein VFN38_09550, partial [Gemmatimonadaceae bacterium]|nr:hypothetical protein [Gemmatimonadaceae bacterium]